MTWFHAYSMVLYPIGHCLAWDRILSVCFVNEGFVRG